MPPDPLLMPSLGHLIVVTASLDEYLSEILIRLIGSRERALAENFVYPLTLQPKLDKIDALVGICVDHSLLPPEAGTHIKAFVAKCRPLIAHRNDLIHGHLRSGQLVNPAKPSRRRSIAGEDIEKLADAMLQVALDAIEIERSLHNTFGPAPDESD
jgi:hypothetical protein